MSLTVVVPTYNERGNVEELTSRLLDNFRTGSIVFVDDGSTDGTAEVLRGLAKANRRIRLYERKQKLGIGSAYKFAFPKCRTTLIAEMDADLSHDPDELPRLVKGMESGYDLVVGSRYVSGGVRSDPLRRRIFPILGNFAYRHIVGFPIRDTTSGFRVYRAAALKKVDLRKLPNDFSFQSAMVYEFARRGFRVGEVPITFRKRAAGEPKYRSKDLLGNVRLLMRLSLRRLWSR